MATETKAASELNVTRLNENLAKVEELSQRLIAAMTQKKAMNPALAGPSQDLYAKAVAGYWQAWMTNPARVMEHQIEYWGKSVTHYLEAQQALASGRLKAPDDPGPQDRRFQNPLWDSHPYFNFIKQQYLINSEALENAVADIEDLDPKEKRRLKYFARQIVDMMAPTNFLSTNPDALERAIETEGESLVKGMENLIADLEANDGELVVRLADESAFEIGKNIATADGEVIFRNRMMEVIQYAPTTDKVKETPIVLFPPWINKFYILDLKEKNSFIRWVVDQGYTLFVVSWVNPDETYRDVSLDTYVEEGFLKAIDIVKSVTAQDRINAIGYCIAGTTLSLTLSLLKQRGDKSIKSATFFTTLTDFADQGEFTPFLQDDFVDGIEAEAERSGVLRSFIMARTFSFLRSNDLVYGPAIKSYMMGETPPAFDLLYWNGDGANLPAAMVIQYLRRLCQDNAFCADGLEILGQTTHIKDVDLPICAVACETDHIAAWRDCYRGMSQTGSRNRTFILSESGHIAGIVNPPSKKKYGHYINDDLTGTADEWMEGATYHEGSWWPVWESWIAKRAGKWVEPRSPGSKDYPPLEPAPGSYVKVKARQAEH
ncbi:Poly-beta-hydroxybutyrate polymerase [Roseivivax jejudonensis]|uniref:Poly-beta-hydroxybutyrate polymerase n=1 Tax=Roseivivax jejudonensis TaxID=1529041 RepID=A0A1X7A1K2_9RHOB|nr:class I poly(R)-hydroxyalkanoic acid synthase [Roseivivax jejudonensis]SLN68022.1 Poly-beta-hydroxybutyrate polymerase [Roseivivax jejudonensis]